jgi:hypothetical protein
MKTKVISVALIAVCALALLTACTGVASGPTTSSAPKGKFQIVRKAALSSKWQMYQMELTLPSNGDFDVDLLGLAQGDKVDGYFYPEKGTGVSVQITAGDKTVYKYDPAAGGINSDRFTFTADQGTGVAYIMVFKNTGTEKELTVFIEVVYPATASLRGPLDLK